MAVTDADFSNQIPSNEISQGKGVRASTASKWSARDLELMALIENPAFSVYKSAAQTVNVATVISWNSTEFDRARTGEKFDLVNNRFTPQVAGDYFIKAQIFNTDLLNGNNIILSLRKNGVVIKSVHKRKQTASQPFTIAISSIISGMNGSTDNIDVYITVDIDSYSILPGAVDTFFQGERILGLTF